MTVAMLLRNTVAAYRLQKQQRAAAAAAGAGAGAGKA